MKKLTIISILLTSVFLSGCGGSSVGNYIEDSVGMSPVTNKNIGYYESSGTDYGNTTITGDRSDYSYIFSANGTTKKTKQDMLNDYENIQNIADSNGGHIENVYNSYEVFESKEKNYISNSEIKYKAHGCLQFTVEINNENVPTILEYLENICAENKFIVTNYTQEISNYKEYKVVNEYEDEYTEENIITEEELDSRLKYADISVRLDYYIPRTGISKLGLRIKQTWKDFWDGIGEIIKVFLALAVGLMIPFIQSIFFYKTFKKIIYKYKLKHPEYYEAKDINIIKQDYNAFHDEYEEENDEE